VTAGTMTGLHHVSFTVSDLPRSVAFYGSLGFAHERTIVVADAAGIGGRLRCAFMAAPGVRLELREYGVSGEQRAPEEHDVGSAHIALQVDDIQAWHRRLSAEGVRFLSPPLHSDTAAAMWVFLLDPDGLPVELVEPDTAGAPSGKAQGMDTVRDI
jgi:catechol 2,3-dioxygenase-like lactoylglutathione lyase family enzyme